MNTLITNPIARLFNFLGRDPQRSMTLFFWGIGVFALGLGFVALGNYFHHLWQVPGLACLATGILLAGWGYIGVFAHRLQRMLGKHKPPSTKF